MHLDNGHSTVHSNMHKEIVLNDITSIHIQESCGELLLSLHQIKDYVVLRPKSVIELVRVLQEYFPGEVAIGLGTPAASNGS